MRRGVVAGIRQGVLDHLADTRAGREVEDFAAAALGGKGKKFKLEPQRLLYSLQWRHNATPPDLHLRLVRDPQLWFDFVATMLLGALSNHDPELRARLRAAAPA
jgi:hypothetical protein